MQYQQLAVTPTRRGVRKNERSPRNNVVSLRLSDQEKLVLDRLTVTDQSNLSDLVREAISFWLARRKGVCLEP